MSFLKPKVKTAPTNVNNELLTGIYKPQAQGGVQGFNYLQSLLTGQGDTAAANAGFDNYKSMAGYEPALRDMQAGIVGGGAASGLLRSGSTAKALTKYGAELNQGFYNNYLEQLGGLSALGNQAGQIITGAGSGDTYKQPSTAGVIAGLGGKLLSRIFSDRRLKENIVQIGTYPNGLPMYEFNYVGGARRLRGVMSDDVRRKYPEAVEQANGFDTVNYAMLGIEMESA